MNIERQAGTCIFFSFYGLTFDTVEMAYCWHAKDRATLILTHPNWKQRENIELNRKKWMKKRIQHQLQVEL